MRRTAILLGVALILLIPTAVPAAFPVTSAVVSVDAVDAIPGAKVSVPIRISGNSLALAGLQVPLSFSSPYLALDSVSFNGSLKAAGMTGDHWIDNGADTVAFAYYPNYAYPVPTVSATEGILATVHFTLSPLAPVGAVIPIDSIYHGDSHLRWTGIGFSNSLGTGWYTPAGFVAGAVRVASPTSVDETATGLPNGFSLSQNYPNPFNPNTVIEFSLPVSGHARLEVFNVLGQSVATPVDERLEAGDHQVEFAADNMPSGIYFYRLSHAAGSATKKMILLK